MESDCIALRGPRLEAAARDVNRRGQGRFRVGFSYAVATCPEPALPDQVDHQGVDQLSEHEQEVGTIERGGLLCAGPPWSRWSTLPAGWRFATRDSARGPPISLGGSRTCARCRGDTAPRSSSWPGSIPAASTLNNNFIVILYERPPKSQERPNGTRKRKSSFALSSQVVSARQHGPSWEGPAGGVKLSDHVGVMVHIADGHGRSVSGGFAGAHRSNRCSSPTVAGCTSPTATSRRGSSCASAAGGAGNLPTRFWAHEAP